MTSRHLQPTPGALVTGAALMCAVVLELLTML